ncbi:MAG TPA: hypothetical protein VFR28_10975, partial [Allosphingosinicella sp.]|nr:hypothetical protein [Allosphingosinicella sp.]
PLGETARLAAAGSAALLSFASVWGLMAAIGRVPARRKSEARAGGGSEMPAEAEAPRLRRADAHPDAPARRPLLARDLGEPLDLDGFAQAGDEPEEDPSEPAEARALPGFLVPQVPEPEWVEETPAEWAREEARLPDAEPEAIEAEPHWAVPEAAGWNEPEPEPEAEPLLDDRTADLPLSDLAARLPDPQQDCDQSLSQLVHRIEFGLGRKRQALPAVDLPPAEEPPVEPEKVGHRLRSAINDLQKIASSGA